MTSFQRLYIIMIGILAITPNLLAQSHAIVKKGRDSIRNLDLNLPCEFEKEFKRINADKTDPRVAFVETYAQFHDPVWPISTADYRDDRFQTACRAVSNQTTTSDAYYDPAHKFFQIYVRVDPSVYNEAVTYFSGKDGHESIMVSFLSEMDEAQTTALAFRNGKWQDVTQEYLGEFKIGKDDYLILPQYGKTARLLIPDKSNSGIRFKHRGWLTWNGQKFQLSTTRTLPGWRCPDHENQILADFSSPDMSKEFRPDFCRPNGDSEPEERIVTDASGEEHIVRTPNP